MGALLNIVPAGEAAADGQRVAARRRVLMKVTLRLGDSGEIHTATVKDISSTGMRATSAVSFFPGTQVVVELPNIGPVPGVITRIGEDGAIGIRFGVVIDPERSQVRVTGRYQAPTLQATTRYRAI